MPHFNQGSVQEIGQRKAWGFLISILASLWSAYACRRTRQNCHYTIILSHMLSCAPVGECLRKASKTDPARQLRICCGRSLGDC